MAHIIVFGNEKGGSGKTTTAMHLIVSLLKMGRRIASIDLDIRQQSLSSYVENRSNTLKHSKNPLEMPTHHIVGKAADDKEDSQLFLNLLSELKQDHDFIIIDTPGSDTLLSRLAHSHADTVITPINDSFVDIDLLGKIEAKELAVNKPGIYSAMLWEQKIQRATREKKEIDWIVVRNRVSSTETINKRNIDEAVTKLAKRFGFRTVPGFGDRVIFKELFLYGLTLLDMGVTDKIRLNHSVIAARQELREFIAALNITF